MKRLSTTVATVTVAVAVAGPAWAHEEISPASVPAGTPVFLTLSAANEKRVDLTTVTLAPPQGTQLGHATRDPAGWTTSSFTHQSVVWTGGAIKPAHFEEFGFDIEPVAQPTTLSFRVTLGYTDGTADAVDVPLTVGAAPAGGTTATTAHSHDEPEDGPATTLAPVAGASGNGGDGLAVAALVTSLVAVAAAVGALMVARRSRPKPTAVRAGAGQDW